MTTMHPNQHSAKSMLATLTSKMFATSFDLITKDEFMGSGFRDAKHAEMNEPQVAFSIIHTYNSKLQKVWRLNFSYL